MLSMLTGVGYGKDRDVPCLITECQFRFYMDRDLRRHLRAMHNISDPDVEEMLRERDALTGGQFWIGGLDDGMPMFDSVEPSMPQTPAHGQMPLPDEQMKQMPTSFFDYTYHDLMLNEDAEMDLAMGLQSLAPGTDVQEGLGWDMLAPVEQFNLTEDR
jgi:general transcription factor IIIA